MPTKEEMIHRLQLRLRPVLVGVADFMDHHDVLMDPVEVTMGKVRARLVFDRTPEVPAREPPSA